VIFEETPKLLNLEFHHLGLAVKHPDQARKYLQMLGYMSKKTEVNLFNVYIQFHEHEVMPRIELVYKYKDSTPIDNILKSNDLQIYHTCYKCKDVKKTIQQLKDGGFQTFRISKSSKDFPFSFYYIKGIGLIEFFEVTIE
jgi:hypothetical protein